MRWILAEFWQARGDETAAVLLLLGALFLGGGNGTVYDLLLAVPAAVYLALTARRQPTLSVLRYVPLAVLAVPLLQLVPLPPALFALLPGRGDLVAHLREAGIAPAWHPWTLDAFATERALYYLLVPLALYWAALVLERAAQRRILALVLGVGFASALLGFAQAVGNADGGIYFYDFTNRGEAVGFFANRNHLASLLVVLVPIGVGLLADRLQRTRRMLDPTALYYLTAVTVIGIGVTATHSRAGLVLLILAIASTTVLLWPTGPRGAQDARERFARWTRWGLGLGFLAAVQFELVALMARLEADPLDDLRWTLASRTLTAAAAYAGTGAGMGTFPTGYYRLGEPVMDLNVIVNHAHNDWLELWFDGGLPAVLVALALLALACLFLQRRWRETVQASRSEPAAEEEDADELSARPRRRRQSVRGLLLGAGLAPLLFALHSAVDYPLRTLALASLAAFCLGVVVSPGQRPMPTESSDG